MKTIGLLGGMSWESTAVYYRLINEGIRRELGGLSSAEILLASVNFAPLAQMMHRGDWQGCARHLAGKAEELERAGADLLLLCTNTMHKVAEEITARLSIPLLHICDVTAERIKADGLQRVGLLGTLPTMEEPFYRDRLCQRHGLEVLVPDGNSRIAVHDIIFSELCCGRLVPSSRDLFCHTVQQMTAAGAQGLIAGCTEISLLIGKDDLPCPFYDTTSLHVDAAIAAALDSVNQK